MAYNFIDGYGSVLTADSSIISGSGVSGTQRPVITPMGLRNDAVASIVVGNLGYGAFSTDSAGRILTKPFAGNEARVQGTSSTQGIFRTSLLGAAGTGLRNYVTDILVSNTGSVATSVSFSDSDASIIGRTIAPATSGSNIHLSSPMRTGALNSQIEYIAGTGTSTLSVSAYGFLAP